MIWFKENYIFNEKNEFEPSINYGKDPGMINIFSWVEDRYQKLNYQESRIKCTIERETNGAWSFIDMTINRLFDTFVTKIYIGWTHTPRDTSTGVQATQRIVNWAFSKHM